MSFSRFALLLLSAGLSLSTGLAQSTEPAVTNEFVQKQFGSNCTIIGLPPFKADFDGDKVEDIVIPAHCTKPMMDEAENNYVVVDPFDAFFGYGDPKITTQFASEDPERRGFSLLVIHGSGAEAWHSAAPKAKFMIVNLPFKNIYVRKLVVRKKERTAIYIEETGADSMTSVLFWDGKRYRYQPLGSNME